MSQFAKTSAALKNFKFNPGTFMDTTGGKSRPKMTMWIILVAVGVLVLSIVGGVIGNKSTRDENCACRKKQDGGWLGFSITYFILSVIAAIVFLVLFVRGNRVTAPTA